MKIAFTTFAAPDWSLAQLLEAGKRFRYDGLELRCDARHQHGVEVYLSESERAQVRRQVEAMEMEVPCLATSLQMLDAYVLDRAAKRIELARDIGARGVRVFAGPLEDGMTITEALGITAEHLRAVGEIAEHHDVPLWLETHDSMSRAADAAAAVQAAARPILGIAYDNLHPFRAGETLDETFQHLTGLLRYVHLHDGLKHPQLVRITPVGQGQMPMSETLAALVKLGYDGYLTGEWFHDMLGRTPEESLDQYYRDIATLAEAAGVHIGK